MEIIFCHVLSSAVYGVDYNLELDLVTISLIAQVLVGWYLVSIVHELPDMILPGACQPQCEPIVIAAAARLVSK